MNEKILLGSLVVIVLIAVFSTFLFLPKNYTNSVNMNVVMHGCIERSFTKSMGIENPSDYENETSEYQFNSNYQNVDVNGNAVTVSYNISHLCGAKIEIEKEIEEGEINLLTKISGGFRCGECVSEIVVGLEPLPLGDYKVNVRGILTDFDTGGLIFSKDILINSAT